MSPLEHQSNAPTPPHKSSNHYLLNALIGFVLVYPIAAMYFAPGMFRLVTQYFGIDGSLASLGFWTKVLCVLFGFLPAFIIYAMWPFGVVFLYVECAELRTTGVPPQRIITIALGRFVKMIAYVIALPSFFLLALLLTHVELAIIRLIIFGTIAITIVMAPIWLVRATLTWATSRR